jgi:hypothetical protein
MDQTIREFLFATHHIPEEFAATRAKRGSGGLWCTFERLQLPDISPVFDLETDRSIQAATVFLLWSFWVDLVPMQQIRSWNTRIIHRALSR